LAFSLNNEARLKYSPSERLVFSILNHKPLPVSSTAIVTSFYKSKSERPPYNSRPIVMGTVRNLVRKVEINNEPFRIARIKQQGNKTLEYQLVAR